MALVLFVLGLVYGDRLGSDWVRALLAGVLLGAAFLGFAQAKRDVCVVLAVGGVREVEGGRTEPVADPAHVAFHRCVAARLLLGAAAAALLGALVALLLPA